MAPVGQEAIVIQLLLPEGWHTVAGPCGPCHQEGALGGTRACVSASSTHACTVGTHRCLCQGDRRAGWVWGAQCIHGHWQQLTCAVSSDFRISRKTQEETVSLLQRKGKSHRFTACCGNLSTSDDPCDRPRGTSVPWTFSPLHGSCLPCRCSGPAWSLGRFYLGAHF